MAGDGRCDSQGHCTKYCTYTSLDVNSKKVVDFKVVSVTEVANFNQMEKKGFIKTLTHIEANGIKVDTISNDRHPQIKKEMRVNHGQIDHQFDPWHLTKSVSKKLATASKKSGCNDLAPWTPSIVNHLWWSAESCNRDPDVLHEKWLSQSFTMSPIGMNRQATDISTNVNMIDCHLSSKGKRSGSSQEVLHVLHLSTLQKTRGCSRTLNIWYNLFTQLPWKYTTPLYLMYLPKLTHFTHDVMKVVTMLAALDHDFNVNSPQVSCLKFEVIEMITWS